MPQPSGLGHRANCSGTPPNHSVPLVCPTKNRRALLGVDNEGSLPASRGDSALSPVTGSVMGPRPTFHIYGAISTGPTAHPHVTITLLNCLSAQSPSTWGSQGAVLFSPFRKEGSCFGNCQHGHFYEISRWDSLLFKNKNCIYLRCMA